jgi:maltooligosyltrehalose trehalohydrolase
MQNPVNRLGATDLGHGRCEFLVWAPNVSSAAVHLLSPEERIEPLERSSFGYHSAVIRNVGSGSRYVFRLDGDRDRPDPASRFQPMGVHGPSEVIDEGFPWEDQHWCGIPLKDLIIYELHVGAFTQKGTFDGVISCLDDLRRLGMTAIELMPVAQFPGDRNWGYDGTYPFAAQNSYGGPLGLKRLVNACHERGLAVLLDVVYNHLGPEGNYLWDYGPYFTDRYRTPWGDAINFDGPQSDHVRRFFIENALYWINQFHVDGLRLDAVHAIIDFSARPFLEELAEAVHARADDLNRHLHLVAESALNDNRLVRSSDLGGFGLDAQWNDDFHHAMHALLTGERFGYYEDFGRFSHLAKAYGEGFVYTGQFSAYRKRRHGNSSRHIPARRFVVFSQNHDQIGNRMRGERLASLVGFEELKLAAGLVLLSPFIPLLFMGEEYGETAPFPYFISHADRDLVEAVRQGRREEFASFRWRGEPPDPQSPETYASAKLDRTQARDGSQQVLFNLHQWLIQFRKNSPALSQLSKRNMELQGCAIDQTAIVRRWNGTSEVVLVYHFSQESARLSIPLPEGNLRRVLDSSEKRWLGPGSRVPREVISQGMVSLDLRARSFVIWTQVERFS